MDNLNKEQRSKAMSAIKSTETVPEKLLGRALWHKGYRYRKNNKTVFGKPDFTFKKNRIAIFVDSEFFHGKDWDKVKKPKTNADFWNQKISRNILRDKTVNDRLKNEGWTVLRFWSKEVTKNVDEVALTIERHIVLKNSKVVKFYPE